MTALIVLAVYGGNWYESHAIRSLQKLFIDAQAKVRELQKENTQLLDTLWNTKEGSELEKKELLQRLNVLLAENEALALSLASVQV